MAKKKKDSGIDTNSLWSGIEDDAFINESNLKEVDIAEYNQKEMTIFSANVNYFRQIIRLSDSLKPVERRILYSMFKSGNRPGLKQKSNLIVGNAALIHNHGDCYPTLVSMSQRWKKMVPLIDGKGAFGSESEERYAAMRYTEASMSKYAYECFFEDYDDDCVEQLFNTASDSYEPMSLPAKFPNILVNGGLGFAVGNSFCIPPFNIDDIIANCEKVMKNPKAPDVFMIPDFPTGCYIVDDGETLKTICDTGKGTIKMRGVVDVVETSKTWELRITALPWFVTLSSIETKLVDLHKNGTLPIKDLQNHSHPIKLADGKIGSKVDYRIIIDKTHDPYAILEKIYKNTMLQKSLGINFKVVLEELAIKTLSLRELILSWIDERRSYKRRLYNKKITKLSARIDLLEILLYLLKAENIEKTLKIIKDSNSDEVVKKLMKHGKMNSYQASKIADMKLSAFTKDARKKYAEEKAAKEKELEKVLSIVKSEKKIDKIILEELYDLKKYSSPRKTQVITDDTGEKIADIDYNIIITKMGLIKKIPFNPDPNKNSNMGSFKNFDAPIKRITCNNLNSILMFDSFGRYSAVPVYKIDTTELSHHGNNLYDIAGLNGSVVTVMDQLDDNYIEYMSKIGDLFMVTLTRNGYIKKTPLEAYTKIRSTKNIKACKLRDDDSLVWAGVVVSKEDIIIYSKKGNYVAMNIDDISPQGKDSMGVIGMKMKDLDECVGIAFVGDKDQYITVITEKGNIKKCEIQYLTTGKGKRSYLTSLDTNDNVVFVSGMIDKESVIVFTRTDYTEIEATIIPTLSRKAKCKKMIPVPQGSSIIRCDIVKR